MAPGGQHGSGDNLPTWHLFAVGALFLVVGVAVPYFSCNPAYNCPSNGCGNIPYQSCPAGVAVGDYFLLAACVVLAFLLVLLVIRRRFPHRFDAT